MRPFAATALVALSLCAASTARALEWPTFITPKKDATWSVGVRFGPYRPRVAANASDPARTWFDSYFNEGLRGGVFGHGPVLKQLELEYYFTNSFGRIGAGFSIGHWDLSARARRCFENEDNGSGGTRKRYVDCGSNPQLVQNGQTEPGTTPTSLVVLPLSLSAVYRADQLMKGYDIPLMPYVKAGFDMGVWWVRAGNQTATGHDLDGNEGAAEGLSWGYHFTFGVAFNLNWLDPTAHGDDDSVLGMVGSHIFFEGTYLGGDTFGAPPNDRLDLTDFTGFIGLTLDFE